MCSTSSAPSALWASTSSKGSAPECLREHRAIITFRFIRLRSLYEILLKGNPLEFRILWCLPILFTTSLPWELWFTWRKIKPRKIVPHAPAVLRKACKSLHVNWNSLKSLNPFFPKASSLPEHPLLFEMAKRNSDRTHLCLFEGESILSDF